MAQLMILFWLLGAAAMGLPLSRLALRNEDRTAVRLFYAITAGHSIQSILLLLLWGIAPLPTAFWLVLGASVSVSLVSWRRVTPSPTLPSNWGMGRIHTVMAVATILVFSIVGFRAFSAGYTQWDAEALYLHSGLVGWLSHGTYPPTHSLEPDDLLHYRFGLHALGAAIAGNTAETPPQVLAATVSGVLPVLVISLVGASLRIRKSPVPGLIAAVLALLGGSLLPFYRVVQLLLHSEPETWRASDLVGGFLLTGNTLDLLHKNPSLAFGFISLLAALWLVWEATESRPGARWELIPAVASLASLSVASEVHFAILAAAIIPVGVVRLALSPRRERVDAWIAIGVSATMIAAAAILGMIRGGMLGGISLVGSSANSLKIVPNLEHWGHVPRPPGMDGAPWISVITFESQFDTAFMLVAIPAVLLLAFGRREWYVALGSMASLVAATLWLTVYPEQAPEDAYRFGQAALGTLLTLLPFVATSSPVFAGAPRVRFWLAWAAGSAITAPHAIFALFLLAMPVLTGPTSEAGADWEAARYLAGSSSTRRVLVPLDRDNDNWVRLYRNDPVPIAMRVLVGASRHAIPMGHVGAFFNEDAYLPVYRRASSEFDRDSITSLDVDWVYVLPAHLSRSQETALRQAEQSGHLVFTREFGQAGTDDERRLYRVNR